MSGIFNLFMNKWYPPKPYSGTLDGKIVLVTGTTSGLGFEAAKKVAALNASTLIITGRSLSRAQDVANKIQDWLKSNSSESQTKICPLALDMSSHEGVESFIQSLRTTAPQVDAAILNAGTDQSTYQISPDGYELTIQVNTLGTVYLGLCLLPFLRESFKARSEPAHLTFISSGTAVRASPSFVSQYISEPQPLKKMSEADNFPPGMMGGQVRYGQSKLLLEYAMRRLASSSSSGSQDIVINSVCPGMCQSDLGRNFQGFGLGALKWVIFTFLARTSEQGANAYLTGLTVDAEGHGKLWRHDRFEPDDEASWQVIGAKEGKEFGDKVWKEIKEIIGSWDSQVLKNL